MKRVVSIKKIEKEPVFDITVDKYANYIIDGGIISHNSGIKYACSCAVFLSKKKEKEGTTQIGNIVHCKLYKGRLTKEGSSVDAFINFSTGLNRYYGLTTMAIDAGIFQKAGTKIDVGNDVKVFSKEIQKNPEKYFTEDVMKKLDEYCKSTFCYGGSLQDMLDVDETNTDQE